MAILREEGSAVAPSVFVHNFEAFFKGLRTHEDHDWSEDLLIVAFHTWLDMVDDSWSDPVTIGVSVNLDTSSIEENRSVLSSVLDKTLDIGQSLLGLKWGNVFVVDSSSNRESSGLLDDLRDPLSGVADHDCDRDGHATLAS